MENKKEMKKLMTRTEFIIWASSIGVICIAFFSVQTKDYLSFVSSLIGATALIFVAKGNVWGQILTVVFSVLYGIISYSFKYYGEMITYLGMTAPIAVASIITWLKNPYKGSKSQVTVNHLKCREWVFMIVLAVVVTAAFYFILELFNTSNLILSTVSVFTSFTASYLTMRRSEYYAFAYAANDIVLIALWVLATISNIGYISTVICFVIFLCNDIYGFINWRRMKHLQNH